MFKTLILTFLFSLGVQSQVHDIEVFKPNLVKFNQIGFPRFIQDNADFKFVFAVPYFYGFLNKVGSGIHIGDGYILTARHVYSITDTSVEKDSFNGRKKIRNGLFDGHDLFLLQLPSPTEADLKVLNGQGSVWSDVHLYNDWALMQDLSYKNQSSFTKVRSISTLKAQEPLWVMGRPYGNPPIQIAVGHFSKSLGRVSLMSDVDLMPGFSGGPVVDSKGNLVGIINTFNPNTREATFMNLENIQKVLKIRIHNSYR